MRAITTARRTDWHCIAGRIRLSNKFGNCATIAGLLVSRRWRKFDVATHMLTLTGHITPADKAGSDYTYVPFDVPAGIARLEVRYAYSHPRHHGDFAGQGNTIDIGIF